MLLVNHPRSPRSETHSEKRTRVVIQEMWRRGSSNEKSLYVKEKKLLYKAFSHMPHKKRPMTSHIVLATETGCTGTGISFNLHAA